MRILVTALGSPGHAYPLVPLATALRDQGHAVTFATGPDVAEGIAATGLEVVADGARLRDGFGPVLARRGLTERPTDPELVRSIAGEAFGDVIPRHNLAALEPRLAADRPDLVIAEVADAGGALAAAAAGVPCVLHSFGRRPGPEAPMYARAVGPVAVLAAERGVLAEGAPLGHAYLDVCPPSLQTAPAGDELPELPLRPTAWNPPVPGSPVPHAPWVYLTLGTAMGVPEVLRAAAAGLASLGVDVLVAAGSVELADLDGLATGRIRVEPFVAQADLLASAQPPALIVHHGGSGTTLAAAAAGVPQVFLPQGADQFMNAAAVTAVGAGARPDPDALVGTARELLGDGPARASARALAAEIAALPGPRDLAASVERWGQPEM